MEEVHKPNSTERENYPGFTAKIEGYYSKETKRKKKKEKKNSQLSFTSCSEKWEDMERRLRERKKTKNHNHFDSAKS